MLPYKYNNYKKGYIDTIMNNIPDSYEDYLLNDREYRYIEDIMYLKDKYYNRIDSIDRDDMDYPPMWDPGL